jgi:hypothetical protein
MAGFLSTFSPGPDQRILDVGFWKGSGLTSDITLLNIHPIPTEGIEPNMHAALGDGTKLEYKDKVFDIIFSNSVIEHLSTFENQARFANECMRVGKWLWIQTPAKTFFVEPHLLTPFIHLLPRSWQRKLLRNFTVWGWLTRPSTEQIDHMLEEIRLLTLAEMQSLFPGCEIWKERFLGFTKSYIAVRRASS